MLIIYHRNDFQCKNFVYRRKTSIYTLLPNFMKIGYYDLQVFIPHCENIILKKITHTISNAFYGKVENATEYTYSRHWLKNPMANNL